MATNKEELVNTIKEWVILDKEMKSLNKELKIRRERKKILTNTLAGTMRENDIDSFDMSSGKIIYSQNKVKTPLSKKHLLECLTKYFQNSPQDERDKLAEFILESREVKVKDNIRLKGENK
jgi:hypothetical protein